MVCNERLRRGFRTYVCKQRKKLKTNVANLRKLGIMTEKAHQWSDANAL